MRRYKNLYDKIISFQNLLSASRLAQRGKRFKDATALFNFRLERELWRPSTPWCGVKGFKPESWILRNPGACLKGVQVNHPGRHLRFGDRRARCPTCLS